MTASIHRRAALEDYFYAVLNDLLSRGVVSQARGEPLSHTLQRELPAVMAAVREDFKAVGIQLATTLVGAGERMLEDYAHKQLRSLSDRIASFFRSPR